MTELLTAKDVEVKAFKKVSFGGYSISEVEDFLNQVADDLEAYALRLNERDDKIHELQEYVRKQESMTDTIKGALIQAQKAASDMEAQARAQGEKILAEARTEAGKVVEEARASAAGLIQESRDKRMETEKRWSDLEQELELRRKEASEQIEQELAAAHAEARRIVDAAEREVEEYSSHLRYLNLQKQQFLKSTVSLLVEFGKTLDRAQEEVESEIGSEPAHLGGGGDRPVGGVSFGDQAPV